MLVIAVVLFRRELFMDLVSAPLYGRVTPALGDIGGDLITWLIKLIPFQGSRDENIECYFIILCSCLGYNLTHFLVN